MNQLTKINSAHTLDLVLELDTGCEVHSPEQRLCEQLIRADTETAVETALRDAGYWDNIADWDVFGGNSANASMIGGQQEAVESALVEKIVNSIDARMLNACHENGIDPQVSDVPQSGIEAIHKWFDHGLKTEQASRAGNISVWSSSKRNEQSEHITVAATGGRRSNDYASISIADTGEGQEPDNFASTFCSLNTGNKRAIPFVQGKHTMGGTGVLRFCGAERVNAHQLQLIVSRRNPAFATNGHDTPWGFTVVRRFPPQGAEKTHTYRYLAPKGRVLQFSADSLAIFPQSSEGSRRADPYARSVPWGTLTKLYEYIRTTYITGATAKSLMFARKLELRMPRALLPVKLYECRDFERVADAIPTLVLTGIMGRLETLNAPAKTLEWHGQPKTIEFRVEGQRFVASVWAFRRNVKINTWRGSDGVVFMLNGQTHAALRDSFFDRQDVEMGALRKSLFVVVDCVNIDKDHEAALFMTSRDRLAGTKFTRDLQSALAKSLKEHQALKDLRNERTRFVGTVDEETQRSLQEFLENYLQQNPELASLLMEGNDIPTPHKPVKPHETKPMSLRQYPTFFRLRKGHDGHLQRTAPIDSKNLRFVFETDAVDDYFDRFDAPGMKCLDRKVGDKTFNADEFIGGWYLSEGKAEMKVHLPHDVKPGDVVHFKFTVEDDNPATGQFVNTIEIKVTAPATVAAPDNVDDEKPPQPPQPSRPRRPRQPTVDAPKIQAVEETDWANQNPEPFDDSTAIRKVDLEGGFEFRYNADNKYLRNAIKQLKGKDRDQQANELRQQFASTMAMLALAIMDAYKKTPLDDEDLAILHLEKGGRTEAESIDWFTTLAAPVVANLPRMYSHVAPVDET